MTVTGQNRACGYQWPLQLTEAKPVTSHDLLGLDGAQHRCGLLVGHAGRHRCAHDNEEAEP